MRDGIRGFAALGLGAFIVIGCGGGGSTGAPAAATAAVASDGGAGGGAATAPPSAEPSAGPASQAPAGGGGTAAGVCELVTGEELAGIFGVPSVKMTVLPGPPDNCIVEDQGGDPLTAWSLTTAQASAVYGAFASDPASIEVPGIGDKAAIVQNTGLLVLKGGSLVVIIISGGADMSEDEATEASKQIGRLAAGRL